MCWHIDCSTFTASSFKIWNSATGIPSPPLALFVAMLPKAHLTSHSRRSGSRGVITPLWLSGLWSSFLYSSSVYFCHLFFISSASVRSIPFLSFIRIDQYQKMDKRNDVKYIWTFFHNHNIEDKNWTYKMTLALAWWTLNSRILSSFRELLKFVMVLGEKTGKRHLGNWRLTFLYLSVVRPLPRFCFCIQEFRMKGNEMYDLKLRLQKHHLTSVNVEITWEMRCGKSK